MKENLQNLMLLDGISESVKSVYDKCNKHEEEIRKLKKNVRILIVVNVMLFILLISYILWSLL